MGPAGMTGVPSLYPMYHCCGLRRALYISEAETSSIQVLMPTSFRDS